MWQQAHDLASTAADENRAFTEYEQGSWEKLDSELDAIDRRITEIRDLENREAAAVETYSELARRPVETGRLPAGATLSGHDKELDHAFRSAIGAKNPAPIELYTDSPRSNYQPGLEYRDTSKSTATQALPVSTYDHVVMHLVENSVVMAAGATVLTTQTGEDYQIPRDTAFVSSALTAEGGVIAETDPTLSVATLHAYKIRVVPPGFARAGDRLVLRHPRVHGEASRCVPRLGLRPAFDQRHRRQPAARRDHRVDGGRHRPDRHRHLFGRADHRGHGHRPALFADRVAGRAVLPSAEHRILTAWRSAGS